MNAMRRRLRAVTWVALVAIWALALAPTVSHALARAQGEAGRWAEVCTPQGLQRVTLGDDAPAAPVTQAAGLAHCAFCGLGGGDGALLPAAAPAGLPGATAGAPWPAGLQASPGTRADWSRPPSRAPPARA